MTNSKLPNDDLGAFHEDALDPAIAAADQTELVNALMLDLLGSMNKLAHDEGRREIVGRLLV